MCSDFWGRLQKDDGVCLGISVKDLQEVKSELSFEGWEREKSFQGVLIKKQVIIDEGSEDL